jgi:hypothetical protein
MKTIVEPGDVFVDADGLAWVGINNYKTPAEATHVQLVYFTKKASAFTPAGLDQWLADNHKQHPESDNNTAVPIEVLRQPFTLIAELRKWTGEE